MAPATSWAYTFVVDVDGGSLDDDGVRDDVGGVDAAATGIVVVDSRPAVRVLEGAVGAPCPVPDVHPTTRPIPPSMTTHPRRAEGKRLRRKRRAAATDTAAHIVPSKHGAGESAGVNGV
jgi:hypothetical protein